MKLINEDDNDKSDKQGTVSTPSNYILFVGLVIAVTMCSSAGTVFLLIPEVPPLLRAAWRLHAQTIVQIIPFVIQFKQYLTNDPEIIVKWKNNLHKMLLSGFFLGLHFGTWVWSLDHTTLAHSLMWVTMYPILLNGGQWILYSCLVVFVLKYNLSFCKKCFLNNILVDDNNDSKDVNVNKVGSEGNEKNILQQSLQLRPTMLETLGSIIGLAGGLIMLGDVGSNHGNSSNEYNNNNTIHSNGTNVVNVAPSSGAESSGKVVTVEGDMMALAGAATMCVYLLVGKSLRKWAPIWLYMTPVAFFAAWTCTFASLSLENTTFLALTPHSVFGFFALQYLIVAFYLGGGAGVGGHTLINTLLRYLSPLFVSTALLMEPLVGSILGAIVGVQGLPGIFTFLGAPVVLIGLIMIVYGESIKK
jgi:drug/metabolite transporter (DMT)-like permease